MTVDLDDDLLVRMLKLDAMLDCPLGMTEHDLRLVKNQLVGDSYRKKQFVLGPGLSKLLNIAKVNCTESKQHLLGHILIIIALVASNQQAIIQVIDSEFSQILTFVIRSARSHFGNVLPALQILKRIVVVKPDIDLPFPELVELAQSRSKAVSEICFEIFSRSSKAQIQSDSQTLISICYSALPYARDALPYLEFINVFFTWQFPWDPILFPTTVFFDLQDHENEACRLKAVICIIRVPSLYASNISDFPRLLRTGFRTLMDLFTRKFIINFDECCRALTQLLDAYPSFSSEASSLVAVLLSNITVDSLRALTILAESSENLREIISAKLDSAFVRLWLTKQNKVHILCANLIRSVSRSLHPTRLKLQKLGVVQILLKELTIVCSMCTESMSDIEISDKSLEGDNLHYVVTLVSALANFLLGFISMPRIDMSEGQLSLLVRLIRSEQNSVRESVCLALKNSCFNACFQRISEVTNVISISDIELLLDDTSEIVRFHSLGLLRNILLPETNRLFDSAAISKLSTRISYFLVSENPQLVLEAILALVNIAAGFRDRKVLLLCLIDVIKAVLGLLDHSWAEIRLASVIFFENLFSRACIFKKKRMILEVPIDKLIALDFTRILTIVQEREQSMGNHDTGARCSRAAVGAQTSLNVYVSFLTRSISMVTIFITMSFRIQELLQE